MITILFNKLISKYFSY
jgi:hypothetical protein